MSSQLGAPAALRGYRLQALYTLNRILKSKDQPNIIFALEHSEDLDIYDSDNGVLEIIQVKDYAESLQLKHLLDENGKGFLDRVRSKLLDDTRTQATIVSFGPIGPELQGAWNGIVSDRQRFTDKLLKKGFSLEEVNLILLRVTLMPLDRQVVYTEVLGLLRQTFLTGEAERASENLLYWISIASEKQQKITFDVIQSQFIKIGRYFAARAAHHAEWFTTIEPIEDEFIPEEQQHLLETQFYQGSAATYKHILSDVDVIRSAKLQEIRDQFRKSKVVIVHGASGQGKSTLAYRYLHDFVGEDWRFRVKVIESRVHALSIKNALLEHASAFNVPIVVYLDVSPKDDGWPQLVTEITQATDNVRTLVTLREEDFRKANISQADFFFRNCSGVLTNGARAG